MVLWCRPKRGQRKPPETWRDHLQRFKMLDPDEQFRTIYESARFVRPVSVEMYHRTSDDVYDGFPNLTASCREFSLLRAHRASLVKLWIHEQTEIGPVLGVKTFCYLGKHGIEIQVPSTSGDNTNVWVVICRGPNRHELRYNLLPNDLKQLGYGSKKLMQNNRPFDRDFNAVHLMTTFLCLKETGKTSQRMSTATNTIWDIRSRNLLGNLYVIKAAVTEKQMEQFIG